MKLSLLIAVFMMIVLIICGCKGKTPDAQTGEDDCTSKAPEMKIVEGGLYATPNDDGDGYKIIKVLKIDSNGYHIRCYSNVFPEIPEDINADTLYMKSFDDEKKDETKNLGIGHLPIGKESFEKWKLSFIQKAEIKEEELEGYKQWKDAEGGYW